MTEELLQELIKTNKFITTIAKTLLNKNHGVTKEYKRQLEETIVALNSRIYKKIQEKNDD